MAPAFRHDGRVARSGVMDIRCCDSRAANTAVVFPRVHYAAIQERMRINITQMGTFAAAAGKKPGTLRFPASQWLQINAGFFRQAQHNIQVLHGSTGRPFTEVVQARNQHSLALLRMSKDKQLHIIAVV